MKHGLMLFFETERGQKEKELAPPMPNIDSPDYSIDDIQIGTIHPMKKKENEL